MKKNAGTFIMGICSFMAGFYLGGRTLADAVNSNKVRADRNSINMMVLNDWVDFLYSGGQIDKYFHEKEINRIMIYGNGFIGVRLRQALENTGVEVAAVMDKVAHSDRNGMVIGTGAAIPDVDCIVITPMFYYDEIYSLLSEKTDICIISIKDILKNVSI